MIWLLRNWRLALLLGVAFAFGAMGIRARWLSDRLDAEKTKGIKRELDAHERMNNVPATNDLSDDDVRERLRDYAKRNGG